MISREAARNQARIAQGLCPKCPTGKLDLNPRTQRFYALCATCRAKKNDRQRMGPRVTL